MDFSNLHLIHPKKLNLFHLNKSEARHSMICSSVICPAFFKIKRVPSSWRQIENVGVLVLPCALTYYLYRFERGHKEKYLQNKLFSFKLGPLRWRWLRFGWCNLQTAHWQPKPSASEWHSISHMLHGIGIFTYIWCENVNYNLRLRTKIISTGIWTCNKANTFSDLP